MCIRDRVCATVAFLMTIFGVYLGNCSSYFLPDDALEANFENYEIWKIMGGGFIKLPEEQFTKEAELL